MNAGSGHRMTPLKVEKPHGTWGGVFSPGAAAGSLPWDAGEKPRGTPPAD